MEFNISMWPSDQTIIIWNWDNGVDVVIGLIGDDWSIHSQLHVESNSISMCVKFQMAEDRFVGEFPAANQLKLAELLKKIFKQPSRVWRFPMKLSTFQDSYFSFFLLKKTEGTWNRQIMVGKWLENGWKMAGKWLENGWTWFWFGFDGRVSAAVYPL